MLDEDPQSFERVLSSMCTDPHPAAVAAAMRFLPTNPGDPSTFPTIAAIEEAVVERLGAIAELSEPTGYVASGGTEGNIQALRIARNAHDIREPNIVVPENAHFSFRKAAELLDVEFRSTAVDEECRADPATIADAADDRTIMVVAVAGSTEYGRVDPIPAIADFASDHGFHCHVDAAWGGFVLPFTDHSWNFDHAPIDTLTIDPHKFGRAAIPAGGLLARNQELLDHLRISTPYLGTEDQVTLGGTRSGAGVASALAVIEELWPEGYRRQFERCQENAEWVAHALEGLEYETTTPELPLVGFSASADLTAKLRARGWKVSRSGDDQLRIVCMPHVTREMLETFLTDLRELDA